MCKCIFDPRAWLSMLNYLIPCGSRYNNTEMKWDLNLYQEEPGPGDLETKLWVPIFNKIGDM